MPKKRALKAFRGTRAPSASELQKQLEQALQHPRVSIVVPNHNGVDFLWNCLFSLQTQTLKPLEIILVDNASTDASVDFVRSNYPHIQVLECQENFGFAAGANLGAKCAKGNLVALLNNDAVVTPDWLFRLVEVFRKNARNAGAVASSIKPKQAGNQAGMGPKALNFLGCPVSGFFETSETVFYPEGCAFLFPPLLLPEGPFDPDYFISQEDVYLGWKFRLRGRRVYQAPGSKVFHEGEGTVGKFPKWKAVFYQARNRWINLLVFYEKTNLFKISPWLLMDTLSRWMKGLLMDWPSVWGITLAFFWIAAHPGAILQKRLAVQKKRKVQDREILQYMSGRVMRDHGAISRIFNFLSLAYCRLFFLRVMEFKPE